MIYTWLFKKTRGKVYIPRCFQEYYGTSSAFNLNHLRLLPWEHWLFCLFAGWVWGGTVFLSLMSSCSLFSLHVACDFLSLKFFLHTGLMWNMGRVWCGVSVGHHAASRPKVEGTGQPCSWWGLCSVVCCPSMAFYIRQTRPCCGVPCPASLMGAVKRQGCWLCRFSWAGHLLESPASVATSLCAGRHLKMRRKVVPSSCLSVKQAKKISLRKRCSDLATPKEAWSHFDSPGII